MPGPVDSYKPYTPLINLHSSGKNRGLAEAFLMLTTFVSALAIGIITGGALHSQIGDASTFVGLGIGVVSCAIIYKMLEKAICTYISYQERRIAENQRHFTPNC
jgi:hypothetical protein